MGGKKGTQRLQKAAGAPSLLHWVLERVVRRGPQLMPLEVLDHLLLQPLRSQLHFLVEAWVVKHVDDGLSLYLSKTKTQNMQPGTTGDNWSN